MYEFIDWAVEVSEVATYALALGFFGATWMALAFYVIAKAFEFFDEDVGGIIGH